MRLAVLSHKGCWRSDGSPSGYATDGGFPVQMRALAGLFDATHVLVPCRRCAPPDAQGTPLTGRQLTVVPLSRLRGYGVWAKLYFPFWLLRNGARILRAVWAADAVHAPIPGDVGTIGIVLALALRKPLFVRHCGNWRVQRTVAERTWKYLMERFAGGRNVMLTTGGDSQQPSLINRHIKWIFSTTLSDAVLEAAAPRQTPPDRSSPRLVIACRQVKEKGTARVIEALSELRSDFPQASLDVVGSGAYLGVLERLVAELNLGKSVTFHGQLPQPRVLDALRQADVFCYPTSASEGFPKVVLEALAAGLPVVSTKVSVIPELLSQGAGVLLDDDSPRSVASGIRRCLSTPARYIQMSAAAVKMARSYSIERWSESIGNELRAAWGPLRAHA